MWHSLGYHHATLFLFLNCENNLQLLLHSWLEGSQFWCRILFLFECHHHETNVQVLYIYKSKGNDDDATLFTEEKIWMKIPTGKTTKHNHPFLWLTSHQQRHHIIFIMSSGLYCKCKEFCSENSMWAWNPKQHAFAFVPLNERKSRLHSRQNANHAQISYFFYSKL